MQKCASCSFVFVREVYEGTESGGREPVSPPVKPRHHQIKAIVGRFPPKSKVHVTEIGAGWGGLASLLSDDPRFVYTGFEPSAARASFCKKRDLNVREEVFEGRKSLATTDIVVLDNVLEHVVAPVDLIKSCREVLSDGGMVVVIVPNLNDVRAFHPRWRNRHLWQPDCHINYFTAGTLAKALEAAGLRGSYFPLSLAFEKGSLPFAPRLLLDRIGVRLMGLNVTARPIYPASRSADTSST